MINKLENYVKLIDKSENGKKICYLSFVLGFLFLVWRARYGYCFNDEPLCLSMAQRLFYGDGLISKEWHGIQNIGGILYPFYAVFHLINKSNEGVFLVLRYCYCILWNLTCVYVSLFFMRRKQSNLIGFMVYIYLVLFSPLDYMVIFYHSVSLMAMLLICCKLINVYEGYYKNLYIEAVIISVLFTLLVLCVPYDVIVYVGCFLVIFILSIIYKDNKGIKDLRKLMLLSVPVLAVMAAVYLWVFVFSRGSFEQIKTGIGYIFDDPEHGKKAPLIEVYRMIRHIFRETKFYMIACVIGGVVVCAYKKFAKENTNEKDTNAVLLKIENIVIIVCSLAFIIYQVILTRYVKRGFLNYQVMYIAIIGILIYTLIKVKDKAEFTIFAATGIVYTYFDFLSSNTELIAICKGMSVIGCLAVVLVTQYMLKEADAKYVFVALLSVLIIQMGSEMATRLYRQYWDYPLPNLKYKIEVGSCKGLKTSAEFKEEYESKYNTLKTLLSETDTKGKKFLSLTAKPVIYVDAECDFATFSTCIFDYKKDVLRDKLNLYFDVNNKYPDIIYCESSDDIIPELVEGYKEKELNGCYIYIKE